MCSFMAESNFEWGFCIARVIKHDHGIVYFQKIFTFIFYRRMTRVFSLPLCQKSIQ